MFLLLGNGTKKKLFLPKDFLGKYSSAGVGLIANLAHRNDDITVHYVNKESKGDEQSTWPDVL